MKFKLLNSKPIEFDGFRNELKRIATEQKDRNQQYKF